MQCILTRDMILKKYKINNISDLKNLNLWGYDLENIDIIKEFINIEIITLSVNKISTLKSFSFCLNLIELYLRKNNIKELTEINNLKPCLNLKILWLEENPCSKEQNYRSYTINILPQLKKLDNIIITPEERLPSDKILNRIQSNKSLAKFQNFIFPKISKRNIPICNNTKIKLNETNKLEELIENQPPHEKLRLKFKRTKSNSLTDENFKSSLSSTNYFTISTRKKSSNKSIISNKNNFILTAIENLLEEFNKTELEYIRDQINLKLTSNSDLN